ncbi:hypothetical protein BSKO_00220 [Bryopsis sp. KO-2023]|nr:hypothetical protein BSKO_00220 [Bryopsis sp. KO-2023]
MQKSGLLPMNRALATNGSVPYERSIEVRNPQKAAITRSPPPRRFQGLRKSDLENKLLITRTSGRKFGTIGEAWVDPRRLWVAAFDIVDGGVSVPFSTAPVGASVRGGVFVKSLREVGDVVLIHSDQEYCPDGRMNRDGLTVLTGLDVKTESGELLGKVRDFVFDPNTGRILKLVFDELGLPGLPVSYLDQSAFDVRDISRIAIPEATIYLRSSARWMRVSNGKYSFLAKFGSILSFFNESQPIPEMDSMDTVPTELQEEYKKILEESRKQQEAYYSMYGNQPRGSSPRDSPSTSEYGRQQTADFRRTGAPPPPPRRRAMSQPEPPQFERRGPNQGPMSRNGGGNPGNKKIDDWLVKEEMAGEYADYPGQGGWDAEPGRGRPPPR